MDNINMSLVHINDNDNIDMEIISNLIDIPLGNDYVNYILDNISYQEHLLSDTEFNDLLYDICDNKIENINEIYKFQKTLQFYKL